MSLRCFEESISAGLRSRIAINPLKTLMNSTNESITLKITKLKTIRHNTSLHSTVLPIDPYPADPIHLITPCHQCDQRPLKTNGSVARSAKAAQARAQNSSAWACCLRRLKKYNRVMNTAEVENPATANANVQSSEAEKAIWCLLLWLVLC